MRLARVSTTGVLVEDHERRTAYAIVGDPVTGLVETRGKLLPATGKERLIGIATEDHISLVARKKEHEAEEIVKEVVRPAHRARHFAAVSSGLGEGMDEKTERLMSYAAWVVMGIVGIAFCILAYQIFGTAA